MSHYAVTTAFGADSADDVDEAVSTLLAPFDENHVLVQHRDEQTGECFWTNPYAAWDWWVLGGRFSDTLPIRTGADPTDLLEWEHAWTATTTYAGRKRALDLQRQRAAAAEQGGRDWDTYARVVAGTPQHRPWSAFLARVRQAEAEAPQSWDQLYQRAEQAASRAVPFVEARPTGTVGSQWYRFRTLNKELEQARATFRASLSYTIEQARDDYAAQPRIAAIRAHYQGFRSRSPEGIFEYLSRDEYVQRCRLHAIPGFATLTHDGRWLAPGRMGWFGMSTDTDESQRAYLHEANAYFDELADDMWLVVVDCHI